MPALLIVKDVMVKNVVSIPHDKSVKSAAEMMNKFGIGCLIVLKGGRVVGIVTERDLLVRALATAADPVKTTVEDVMSKPIITIGPEETLEDAVKLMFEHKIKKLPVIEKKGDEARLVGLITLTDVARLYPALMDVLKKLFEAAGVEVPKSMEKVMRFYVV